MQKKLKHNYRGIEFTIESRLDKHKAQIEYSYHMRYTSPLIPSIVACRKWAEARIDTLLGNKDDENPNS
jgi:hypothetical protein